MFVLITSMVVGGFIIKEIVYELVELHKNRRDEELKKRLFHMNRRWSV